MYQQSSISPHIPVIWPDDNGIPAGHASAAKVDVTVEYDQTAVVLGWDLVLWYGPVGPTDAWVVSVCDGSANHLHTLAVGRGDGPSETVLAAAIQTARDAFPTYVSQRDQRTGETYWQPDDDTADEGPRPPQPELIGKRHGFIRDRNKAGFICECGQPANVADHGR